MKIPRRFCTNVFGILTAAFILSGRHCMADQAQDDYLKEWSAKCDQLLAEWKAHPGKPDDDLAGKLIEAGVRADRAEEVEMVAAGTMDLASIEIKAAAKTRIVYARILRNLGKPPTVDYEDGTMDCVFRRMTKNCFEAWTPKHGWLFNNGGKLISEARPPRHGGIGREWHGAFLPDGSWVTTDLWDYDRTLTFFSKNGKWMKEIPSEELAPPKQHEGNGHDLIGWARCDRNGEGWVVSVGSEGGRAVVFVKPQGKAQLLEDQNAPWKLCYPRDMEPKGDFTELFRPSDDFKEVLNFTEASHGTWVGYPHYERDDGKISEVIPGGDHNFGFLPGSHDVFMNSTGYGNGNDDSNPPLQKTWFFSADGTCLGWMHGSYLADAPGGKGIWLLDNDNCTVALDGDLKPQSRTRFLIGGRQAAPMKLFPDLRLGFFTTGGEVVLARW